LVVIGLVAGVVVGAAIVVVDAVLAAVVPVVAVVVGGFCHSRALRLVSDLVDGAAG
jgi:hypothetical protein